MLQVWMAEEPWEEGEDSLLVRALAGTLVMMSSGQFVMVESPPLDTLESGQEDSGWWVAVVNYGHDWLLLEVPTPESVGCDARSVARVEGALRAAGFTPPSCVLSSCFLPFRR